MAKKKSKKKVTEHGGPEGLTGQDQINKALVQQLIFLKSYAYASRKVFYETCLRLGLEGKELLSALKQAQNEEFERQMIAAENSNPAFGAWLDERTLEDL